MLAKELIAALQIPELSIANNVIRLWVSVIELAIAIREVTAES
jgi:hypothetical protein